MTLSKTQNSTQLNSIVEAIEDIKNGKVNYRCR